MTNCKLLSCNNGSRSIIIIMISIIFIISLILKQSPPVVESSPIANGHLLSKAFDSSSYRHSAGFLRDPMPWEDGYFDPSYHPWPKENRQQQAGDKQSVKFTSQNKK